ncbi:MAG TPA: FG-GAP-like repeat-containing protein, partial [Puia sp.]|nr:FG-GAP-like repeat-containing protein [Puia sp.]
GYMRDYTNMDFLKYIVPEEIRKALLVGQKPDLFEMVKKMPSSQLKSYLFRNNGNLQFGNVTQQWGMGIPSLSNGAAYADLDNDGDWDLVVNNINQPAFIWQNHAEDLKNSYLKIKLSGEKKNTFGIGAKVIVSAADGFRQIQQLEAAHGFQSSMEPCLIFGLGKRQLATVMVIWPDGKKQVLVDQPVNRTMVLEQKNAAAAGGSGSLNGQVAAGAAAARAGAGFGVGGSGAAGAGSGAGGSGAGSADMASMDAGKMLFTELRADSLRWAHIEDGYNDFKIEPLLPHQYSRMGPALAVGDVNGDGKQDFFVGGAKGQPCAIFINEGNGQFSEKKIPVFQDHTDVESVQAIFADLDHDGDLDLYVVSGGNEGNFQDHIYWNDGKGNFSYTPGVLPVTASSGGAVVAFDMDGDGDLDIFRAGQVSTGAYPSAPQSYLFENSRGVFKDVTPDFLQHIGMVNTALVADINKDGVNDLILAGEFMPVTILYGQKTAPFFTAEHQLKIPHSTGWWNCLKIEDIDNDGDLDIIAGNEGLNTQMKPTASEPVTIDAADIDNNGTLDAILSYYIQGKSYPVATRDELLDQIPSLKVKFPSYEAYSDATVKDIFSKEQLAGAIHLEAEEFRSGIFINESGHFRFLPFTNEAQAFPVRDILVEDLNHDGLKDLLLAGNNYAVRAQWGRQDAGKGLLLTQNKGGGDGVAARVAGGTDGSPTGVEGNPAGVGFTVVHNTGFQADKDVRKMARIDNFILVANNNDKIQLFTIH